MSIIERFNDEDMYIPLNVEDPMYFKIYPETLPPLDAYRYQPIEQTHVTNATKKGPGQRKFFECW